LNTKLKYIGIDGCRSGWFYVGFDMKNSYSKPVSRIVQTASERFLRKHVAVDDVIDAIAGAVTAMLNCQIVSIPDIPEIDHRGLKMEIVYPELGEK